jgi:hypothetical protein
MQPLQLYKPWEEVKEQLKEINNQLTDEDLVYDPGNPAALLETLAKKMNRSTEAIRVWVESVAFNEGKAS